MQAKPVMHCSLSAGDAGRFCSPQGLSRLASWHPVMTTGELTTCAKYLVGSMGCMPNRLLKTSAIAADYADNKNNRVIMGDRVDSRWVTRLVGLRGEVFAAMLALVCTWFM